MLLKTLNSVYRLYSRKMNTAGIISAKNRIVWMDLEVGISRPTFVSFILDLVLCVR